MKRGEPGTARWSLVRRLTGGVLLIALLSLAAQAFVLGQWLAPLMQDLAGSALVQADQLRVALEAVPPAERDALARRLSTPEVLVSREPPADGLNAADPATGQVPQPGQGQVTFRLEVDDELWWVIRRVPSPVAAINSTLLVWLAVLAGATLLALWASVRLIARPIGRLAEQLAAQQGELRPLPLQPRASREMQSLVSAFNGLATQVGANASVRQQLLAGVSHDLRTPLARLRLRAETQVGGATGDALTADLQSLEHIVNQFLAYVQGDAATDAGPVRPLAETVRALVARCEEAGEPLQALVQDVALDLPAVPVQRLLDNLIGNARAHGRPPVAVSLTQAGGRITLSVTDQGSGMSAPDFERAQQPFVRLSGARSELGHCGLGLAIVAQVARHLGAELGAGPAPGGGYAITVAWREPAG